MTDSGGIGRRGALGLGAAAWAGLALRPGLALAAGGSGTAVAAIDADPPSLNPALSTDYAVGEVTAKVYEGLVWLDRDYTPHPALATSWEASPDGKTFRFALRQGVTWHDGKPFSSADVKFTFEEVLAKLHPRTAPVLQNLGATVETPDDHTVVFTLQRGYAPFLVQMTVFDAPILPRHVFQGTNVPANPASQAPVGTGPFKFAEWNRGATIRVVRNESYWDSPKPYLADIVFQIVPQGANRSAGLQTGELDIVSDFYMPKPDLPRLIRDNRLQNRQGVNIPAIWFAMFNTASGVFAKKEARQAVAMAVDRPRLVQQVMGGLARPGVGAFGDGFGWLVNEEVSYARKYPLDPARARALLQAAGHDGKPVRMPFDAARPQLRSEAQILRENLRAIGLEVQLEPLERSVMLDRVYAKREFDITLQSFFSAGDPAIGYTRLYVTNTTGGTNNNASGYSNPRVDALLGEAATAPDRDRRAALYRELQVILNEDLPSLVLFDEQTVDVASKALTGIWAALDTRDQWAGVRRQGS
ncbi:ABC transporter substrate-binding protein [Roseomonas sp. BN140053]|uniref:ABC transporter substrate-binding protein n=1 Tax=Roseomonas sp. BN140053 TaxID=3391898 RepID=UPI0039E9A41D